jgi:hypothetical protein
MAATTMGPYGYKCFLTLWVTLAYLNTAQNLKPSFFLKYNQNKLNKYFKLKMQRFTSLKIYPLALLMASKFLIAGYMSLWLKNNFSLGNHSNSIHCTTPIPGLLCSNQSESVNRISQRRIYVLY